jgi:hypothetical protein
MIFVSPVLAQITNPAISENIGTGQGSSILGRILGTVINLLLVGGVLTCFLFIILGAYNWIAAGGDKGKLQQAQQSIIQAIVALMILFSVYALMSFLGNLFGINLIELNIPTLTQTGSNTN